MFKSLETIHQESFGNGEAVAKSTICGCFYCGEKFTPDKTEFITERDGRKTAICPHCQIDSVICDGMDLEITDELLSDMHRKYFCIKVPTTEE